MTQQTLPFQLCDIRHVSPVQWKTNVHTVVVRRPFSHRGPSEHTAPCSNLTGTSGADRTRQSSSQSRSGTK